MASGKGSNPEWNSKGIITRILLDKEEEIQENLPLEVCVTNSTKEVQCGAPKIAKLVYNSNNYGLWYLELQLMGFINQLITGGPHIV